MATKKNKKQQKQPKHKNITSARQWGRARAIELPLPSGNVCLIRRPGLPELLGAGIFPDPLLEIINESMQSAQARLRGQTEVAPVKSDEDLLREALGDSEKLSRMFEVFDRTIAYTMVEPKVLFHKYEDDTEDHKKGDVIPDSDRDPNILYTDDVDETDKTFIFNYVTGGSSDLSRFREEQASLMADIQDGLSVSPTPKRASLD